MSDSLRPHGLQPTRLLHPWHFPSKNTGVGCRFLLQCMSCPILCNPMDCSIPGFPELYYLSWSLLKLMSIKSVMPSNHLVLCRPLLLLPSILPSFRIFSSESVFLHQLAKYWSVTFRISPSNEYPGLISFRVDWFDLLASQVYDR